MEYTYVWHIASKVIIILINRSNKYDLIHKYEYTTVLDSLVV